MPATVLSRDGTTISYFTFGQGPPVIVIPGVMTPASSYFTFARTLAESCTVHLIERRGRGGSGPQGDNYGIATECEDLAALRRETGATFLVGHSYGGLIALEAARNDPTLQKIAVYEPGVSVDGLLSTTWIPTCRALLAQHRDLDALTHYCVTAGPDHFQKIPPPLMKLALRTFLSRRRRDQLTSLLPANLLETAEVGRLDNTYENYREISAPTLILSGARNGLRWVAPAMAKLSTVIPHAQAITFPRLDHFGIDQKAPTQVANTVRTFFTIS